VYPVGQQHGDGAAYRVGDQRGAGEAGVAEGPAAGEPSHVPALVELDAEAVRGTRAEPAVAVDQHRRDRRRAQHIIAAGEQRLGKPADVGGGAEQPGVARDTAEVVRLLVVHLAANHATAGPRHLLGSRAALA
jgi:hypothetical protein